MYEGGCAVALKRSIIVMLPQQNNFIGRLIKCPINWLTLKAVVIDNYITDINYLLTSYSHRKYEPLWSGDISPYEGK